MHKYHFQLSFYFIFNVTHFERIDGVTCPLSEKHILIHFKSVEKSTGLAFCGYEKPLGASYTNRILKFRFFGEKLDEAITNIG